VRIKIVITGKVHGVGYRVKLINMALEYGIDRFSVFNMFINGEEAVVCLIDAPDDLVELFKSRVKIEKPEKAVVKDVKFEEYRYEVPPIERCMQAFQMEHWGKAVPILLNMLDEIKDVKRVVREESEKTRNYLAGVMREEGEKTRRYLADVIRKESEKTRNYLAGVIREESDKTRSYLGSKIDESKDYLADVMKEEGEKTRGEIRELRSDLKSYLDERLKKIESEIEKIKAKLGMV